MGATKMSRISRNCRINRKGRESLRLQKHLQLVPFDVLHGIGTNRANGRRETQETVRLRSPRTQSHRNKRPVNLAGRFLFLSGDCRGFREPFCRFDFRLSEGQAQLSGGRTGCPDPHPEAQQANGHATGAGALAQESAGDLRERIG